tara:strand:+ start:15225 stop:16088 length:864 start_codon:yes stop_codon:yes gene_type:complete
MTELILSSNNDPVTMSSREIAELTGKQHKHVIRDIRIMLLSIYGSEHLDEVVPEKYRNRHAEYLRENAGEIMDAVFGDGPNRSHQDSRGFSWHRDRRGYVSEFNLNRELTETLITGYSITLRHKVIKRLHELEQQQAAPAWIDNLSPQARIVIEDLNSQVSHFRNETNRLNAVCNDLAENLRAGLTPVEFCRMLNGVNLNRVQPLLVERKRLLKTPHGYRSAAAYRDKLFTERRYRNKDDRPCEKVVLTKRGAKWLYAQYEQGQLAMRKDWDGRFTHVLLNDEVKAA